MELKNEPPADKKNYPVTSPLHDYYKIDGIFLKKNLVPCTFSKKIKDSEGQFIYIDGNGEEEYHTLSNVLQKIG